MTRRGATDHPAVLGGLGALVLLFSLPAAAQPQALRPFDVLERLIRVPGVSGHEEAVRDTVRALLPTWARPSVDQVGNLAVSFGTGDPHLLFVAHLDETGFEVDGPTADGRLRLRPRGGFYPTLHEAHPAVVWTPEGPRPGVIAPRQGYLGAGAKGSEDPFGLDLKLDLGLDRLREVRDLKIPSGTPVTVPKRSTRLGPHRAAARGVDDRAGSAALILAIRSLEPGAIRQRVTFLWAVAEEVGLEGASAYAETARPAVAFAVDTYVSSDSPLEADRVAWAPLGKGVVIRALDSSLATPPNVLDRIQQIARGAGIPLQVGVARGGNDASAFLAGGALATALSWPGRYSHSPVEVIDERDLAALADLVRTLVLNWKVPE